MADGKLIIGLPIEQKLFLTFIAQNFHENCRSKSTSCRKLGIFSEMQDDALRHREGLKG